MRWIIFACAAGVLACEDFDALDTSIDPVDAELQGKVVQVHPRSFEMHSNGRVLVVPQAGQPMPELGDRVTVSGSYERLTRQPFVRQYDKDYHPWEDMSGSQSSVKATEVQIDGE